MLREDIIKEATAYITREVGARQELDREEVEELLYRLTDHMSDFADEVEEGENEEADKNRKDFEDTDK